MLACDMEKKTKDLFCSKRPMCTLSQNGYGACNFCSGLELIGPAHEELETPEAVLGAGIEA